MLLWYGGIVYGLVEFLRLAWLTSCNCHVGRQQISSSELGSEPRSSLRHRSSHLLSTLCPAHASRPSIVYLIAAVPEGSNRGLSLRYLHQFYISNIVWTQISHSRRKAVTLKRYFRLQVSHGASGSRRWSRCPAARCRWPGRTWTSPSGLPSSTSSSTATSSTSSLELR